MNRRILITCFMLSFLSLGAFVCGQAQERKYSTFYHQRATLFESLPTSSKDIIFLGNSITNGGEWSELFGDKRVKNRGISGDVCMGVYDRLDPVLRGKPAKIFLLIGINDVNRGASADTIAKHIGLIVRKVKRDSPKTKLYLQSVLPVSDAFRMFQGHTSRWQLVPEINARLQELARAEQVTFIDLYPHFVDHATGKLKAEYTNDGLHLLGSGYLKWRDIVKPYVKER